MLELLPIIVRCVYARVKSVRCVLIRVCGKFVKRGRGRVRERERERERERGKGEREERFKRTE